MQSDEPSCACTQVSAFRSSLHCKINTSTSSGGISGTNAVCRIVLTTISRNAIHVAVLLPLFQQRHLAQKKYLIANALLPPKSDGDTT